MSASPPDLTAKLVEALNNDAIERAIENVSRRFHDWQPTPAMRSYARAVASQLASETIRAFEEDCAESALWREHDQRAAEASKPSLDRMTLAELIKARLFGMGSDIPEGHALSVADAILALRAAEISPHHANLVEDNGDHDVAALAETYLAMNAAESGSSVLIAGLLDEVHRLRAAEASTMERPSSATALTESATASAVSQTSQSSPSYEELVEGLEPFAEAAAGFGDADDNWPRPPKEPGDISVGHFRHAASLVARAKEGK